MAESEKPTHAHATRTGDESSSIGPGKMEVSSDVDVAAAYANHFTDGDGYSTKEWSRLRWKLDLRLVPLLWFNITLGAMDKVTTATAALYGFRKDTDLTGDRYSWVGSAFYVCAVPVSFILHLFAGVNVIVNLRR